MKLCKHFSLNLRTKSILFLLGTIMYKAATEIGYIYLLSTDTLVFPIEFNLVKYVNSWIWCLVMFLLIRYNQERISVFMLYLLYYTQVIPLSSVYALQNENSFFYNTICFSICLVIVYFNFIKKYMRIKINSYISKLLVFSFVFVLIFFCIYIFLNNGLPTLTALNIYKVYELRGSGIFKISKYGVYFMDWLFGAIVPFLIAKYCHEKKICVVFLLSFVTVLAYLYSGHKTYLFALPLILFCSVLLGKKDACRKFYFIFIYGYIFLTVFALFSPVLKRVFEEIYSLIGRRVMLDSAVTKYKYYDFFTANPKLGLAGIFPRSWFPISNPYGDETIAHIIGAVYYNKPSQGANTGFLAEGYMRFGYVGIFFCMFLYTLIIELMEKMKERVGYSMTISSFVYPMLMLTDGHLIDSLFFGKFMFVVIILLVYKNTRKTRRVGVASYEN